LTETILWLLKTWFLGLEDSTISILLATPFQLHNLWSCIALEKAKMQTQKLLKKIENRANVSLV
jgi:hypothetical protein